MANAQAANAPENIADPWSLPIDQLNVTQAELFQNNVHGEYFRRLRKEAPVHY